jgi:putative oxidoreductase
MSAARKESTMKRLTDWLFHPPVSGPKATVLIRWMAGGVFLWEGILKFVYTNQGVGRFTKLGIPFPGPTAHFVAVLEIAGGLLLMAGFLTRFISIPFVIEMIVAILSTKISLYLGTSPLPLPPAPPQVGPWAVLHEIRSDYAQIMSVLFLMIAGPGPLSVDAVLGRARAVARRTVQRRSFQDAPAMAQR